MVSRGTVPTRRGAQPMHALARVAAAATGGAVTPSPLVVTVLCASDMSAATQRLAVALDKLLLSVEPALPARAAEELASLAMPHLELHFYDSKDPISAGFATFLHVWLVNRPFAWMRAPSFTDWFESVFLGRRADLQREFEQAREVIARSEIHKPPAVPRSHAMRLQHMVTHSMINVAGEPVGPPLAAAAELVRGRRTDFALCAWALNALHEDDAVLPANDATRILREIDCAEFQKAASMVDAWNAALLRYGAEAGCSPTLPSPQTFLSLDALLPLVCADPEHRSPALLLKSSSRRIPDLFKSVTASAAVLLRAASAVEVARC